MREKLVLEEESVGWNHMPHLGALPCLFCFAWLVSQEILLCVLSSSEQKIWKLKAGWELSISPCLAPLWSIVLLWTTTSACVERACDTCWHNAGCQLSLSLPPLSAWYQTFSSSLTQLLFPSCQIKVLYKVFIFWLKLPGNVGGNERRFLQGINC